VNRKKIGLLTICLEGDYQQRVMDGIFSQCQNYNYDVVVFSPLAQICNYYKDYLEGELNIYEMINFDFLDGVIITPLPMTDNRTTYLTERLVKQLQEKCKCPVVSLDYQFGDNKTVLTDDKTAFYHITKHLIEKHNCKNLSMLGGVPDFDLSKRRIEGFKQALKEANLPIHENQIYDGDYWYTSGEALAKRYITKELELPDAIVCASDHMAIGLTNELIKNGIKIPQDVIITGYEANKEAVLNNPPITSYYADEIYTAKSAVNYLHSILNPQELEVSVEPAGEENLCIGDTCGCSEDISYTRNRLKKDQLFMYHNFDDNNIWNNIDIGMMLESYMTERLTGTETPYDCIGKIYESKYLLQPYEKFYLCLNENWLDSEYDISTGYSNKMQLALIAESDPKAHGYEGHVLMDEHSKKYFSRSKMLPALHEKNDGPRVFYFVPVHFNNRSLGYAVLQNPLTQPGNVGPVFRNFIRNVNNALEMTRAKHKISRLSEHDAMTGLMNRRGMEIHVQDMIQKAEPTDMVCAIVIDMDGLKIINDTYGHSEGDEGIVAVSEAANSITEKGELCMRAGGDEFYIIGVGNYDEEKLEKKRKKFDNFIKSKNSRRDFPVSASFGYAYDQICTITNYNEVIHRADFGMYLEKRTKKNKR